jgi:ribosomal protein L11 methyltransferase
MAALYEIRLSFKTQGIGTDDLIRVALVDLGFSSTEIAESSWNNKKQFLFYTKTLKKAHSLQNKLKRFKHVKCSVKLLKSSDWQNRWKDELKPFKLTKNFRIIPYWRKSKIKKISSRDIIIDTKNVFGLGTHPTTKITAQLIESKRNKFCDFLDIGTGTGILSIVACRCGANSVWAVDAIRQAVKIAKDNFALNNIEPAFLKAVDFGKADIGKKFDLVAANIVTDELIRLKKKIVGFVKKGGFLAISGISAINYERFKKSFKFKVLRCLRVSEQEGWYGFLYKKV